MSKFWKRLLSLVFALIVLAGLLGSVFVVPVLTTQIVTLCGHNVPAARIGIFPAVPVTME
jgi:hypothetical protein